LDSSCQYDSQHASAIHHTFTRDHVVASGWNGYDFASSNGT
jgi:hypothetical protein